MRILKQRKQNRIDRRMALQGVPMIRPGVSMEDMDDGNVRVIMTIKRGTGFFERMRPPETRRSYDLDEFGAFVVRLIDGKRTVLDVINKFEQRFKLSRREVELSVVAFFKLLMQRNVLLVAIPEHSSQSSTVKAVLTAMAVFAFSALHAAGADNQPARPPEPGSGSFQAEAEAAIKEIQEFSSSSLYPGSEGNLALEKLVEERFKASGFETGAIRFDTPVLEPGSLTLDFGIKGKFVLEAMHPALMRPGNFAQNDFDSRLVYLGKGGVTDLDRLKGVSLEGAIAVMDYDCGDKWMDMLRFDIEGFVFVGSGVYAHEESLSKVYNSEVAVPRFFIDGDKGGKLRELAIKDPGRPVKAQSVPSRWKNKELRDLWTMVPGSDKQLSSKVIVLTAALDANSAVPDRAYGAQRAVNLHILLKLLDDFKKKPPLYSVMLVAVNAHTQLYAGERHLAWHLMANEDDVEVMRDEVASEMRMARLHTTEYGKLKLDPITESDKTDLHIMIEIMRKLDSVQYKAREKAHKQELEKYEKAIADAESTGESLNVLEKQLAPQLDEVLDLTPFSEQDIQSAINSAEAEMIDAYNSFFAKRGRNLSEVEQEKKEDLALLETIRTMSFEEFMAKAGRVKSAFDDEKLFEKWRSSLDKSTGRRVYVKTQLQDAFKSRMNKVMQDILITKSPKRSEMSDEEREKKLAELDQKRSDLLRVLVLFNKMDLGVGRSRTQYRQIAVNDTHRELLKEEVNHYVEQYSRWQRTHDATLERDTASGAIRQALGRHQVALVIALEIDAHSERVGLSYQSPRLKAGWFNGFASICKDIAAVLNQSGNAGIYVDALSGDSETTSGHYFSLPESGIHYFHGANKTPAFAMKSAFSDTGRLFGPYDTADHLEPQKVLTLQKWTRQFITALTANEKAITPANLKKPPSGLRLWSSLIRTYNLEQFSGKPIPTRPIPGCLMAMYESSTGKPEPAPSIVAGDVVNCYMGISDTTANSYFYGIAESRRMAPLAYLMDEDFKDVLFTIDQGRVQSSKQIDSNVTRSLRATMPMFECREFVIKNRRDPAVVSAKPISIQEVWPKEAKGQSDPEKYGIHGARSLSPARSHNATGPIGIYLYQRRPELDQDNLMIITADKRCILNSTEENPKGEGFASQKELGGDIVRRAASDMSLLNKSRNAEMKGVVNQLLDEFIKRGDVLIEEAERKKTENDHAGYLRKIYEAFGNQVKAYREIQQMNADMLKAVVVYMALMLPFCFFLQKLLFNFKKLEHELAGFTALFFSMFILFRFIHPAFRMAMSPEAIFIAFVLGAIGVFTTGVLRSRFNEEMTLLFRGVGGIGEEVGYGTVGTTAMLIGVQNMRRRRVRTTLTTATIILVVFTMLAFSSVSRKAKPTLIAKSNSAPYTGLFYHWPNGVTIDEDTQRVLRDLFADRAEIKIRRLLKNTDPLRMELTSDSDKFINIKAVTGLPLKDGVLRDSMAVIAGEQFSSLFAEEILITVSAADALGLGSADVGKTKLRLLGREWLLKGLIDDQRYRLARDLDPNLPLIPFAVDPIQKGEESLDVEVANITDKLIETSALAIIPEGISAELGAHPRCIAVVFPDFTDENQLGTELRRVLGVTDAKFYVGSRAPFKLDEDSPVYIKPGVYYVGSSYRTAIGGLAKLIIPLIIAGSIILNTMLGTVYERKSEIAVFNAIGLNPTHIFMFFLAEAVVYSFIGAVGGYLIGQILTIGLKSAGLIQSVNINFSSLMVVYAILFTMTLVILSTIYPGYVATRTAVPSGKRKWTMPDNDGQHMSVVFPFIYRPRLAYGVMYYLQQFFVPMSDQSMGDLIAKLEEIKTGEDSNGHPILSLRYNIALSPYDLGVTESVTFITKYDEVVKSFRLHMEVDRISGRDTNWITTNKPFLERMRKFLIRWRNIDPTRQAWFVKHALEMFKNGHPPVRQDFETVTPTPEQEH